jgi:hypothetical protein
MLATTDSATTRGPRLSARRRRVGLAAMVVGIVGWLGWIVWRVATLALNVIPILALAIEVAGAAIGVVVAFALANVNRPRSTFEDDRRDPWRYAFAVADRVERTRAADLHREVRSAAGAARRSGKKTRADVAMGCVLIDGPRRLAMIVVAVLGLLIGVSPMPVPTVPVLVSLAIGVGGLSAATVVLSAGRIAVGDRLRWTYGSIGEVLIRDDVDGVAPRRWVGTVGTIVVVNLAVALRGMSDRWTHGLPSMTDELRIVAMVYAMMLVAGSLYTLVTTAAPQLDNAHLVSRRLEERTARQSALGGALCVGLIGLLAGVLPGCVDAGDDHAVRIEHVTEREVGTTTYDGVGTTTYDGVGTTTDDGVGTTADD